MASAIRPGDRVKLLVSVDAVARPGERVRKVRAGSVGVVTRTAMGTLRVEIEDDGRTVICASADVSLQGDVPS